MKPAPLLERPHLAFTCLLIATVATTLAACGGSSDDDGANAPAAVTVGAGGGTVTAGAPNGAGAQVDIPPGALAADTPIAVEQTSDGAPPLPAGVTAFGAMFKFTPHGTAFGTPATLTLPFAANTLPAGTQLALYKTTAGQTGWERVAGATATGATISGPVSSFSFAQAVAEPLPDPAPACDQRVTMNSNITGKVLDPRGRPHIGHVVLRDRANQVGAIRAEASANAAGFFLLNVDGVVTSAGCPRSYVIEVDSTAESGAKLYGELDVTSLFPVGGTGQTEEDITATPVILAEVE